MFPNSIRRACAALTLLACVSCSSELEPTTPSAPAAVKPAPTPAATKAPPVKTAASEPAEIPTPAEVLAPVVVPPPSDANVRRDPDHALTRLPRATLFALRFPEVERAVELFRSSIRDGLLGDPSVAGELDRRLDMLETAVRREVPDYDELRTDLARVRGDLVIALTGVDPSAFAAKSPSVPFTVAAMFDAADEGDTLSKLLVRGFREYEKANPRGVTGRWTDDQAWYRHIHFQGTSIDVVREGDFFRLELSAVTSQRAPDAILPALAPEDSFASTTLVRSVPPSTDAAPAVYQMFLHLQPVWDLVRLLAPADARQIIEAGGFDAIRGITMEGRVDADGFHDRLTWQSAGARDLFSRVVRAGAISPRIVASVPADHEHALVAAVDLPDLFNGVLALMPQAEREAFETDLANAESGIDVRADLIENLGPTFAVSARGNFLEPGREGIELFAAMEVRDGARLQPILEKFVAEADEGAIQTEELAGAKIYSVPMPPIPGLTGALIAVEPAFALVDGCWFVATSPDLIREAVRAASATEPDASRLSRVLSDSGDETWMVSVSQPAKGEPNVATARKTADGLMFEADHGTVTTGVGCLAAMSVVSSVAIPRLMAARMSANETAAIKTLRDIGRAQAIAHSSGAFDRDGDQTAEYALLEELCGTERLAEEANSFPFTKSTFREMDAGTAMRSGYLFRIDLRSGAKNAVSEVASARKIDANPAEERFVAYAWPLNAPSTGQRAFAIDSNGIVYGTRNVGEKQHYSGRTRPPAPNAWCLDAKDVRDQFKPDVHLGGDGESWQRVD